MTTIADRIRQRLEATGKTAHAASLEAGGSPSLIPNILNGRSSNPRVDTLDKIAEVLGTTGEWLMYGAGQVAPVKPDADFVRAADVEVPPTSAMPKDLPVYGSALGSVIDTRFEGIEIFSTMPADYVRRPPALAHVTDGYAIYVTGDSMHPMHPHGALRIVHPHRPVSPGDTVVVQTRSWDDAPAQGYIKILRRRNGDRVILEQLNPPAVLEIPLQSVISIHKVLDLNDLFGV